MNDLDDIDRTLITVLQKDGRKSFKEIADETGIPASSVRYRVQRLEDTGVLQVVGIANPLNIGFDHLALVGIHCEPGTANSVCAQLVTFPETSYVVVTSGGFDVMVEIVCRNMEHYKEFVLERLQLTEGVRSTETFFVLEVHKLAYGWGVA